ncbi:gem-associated protein 8 isoform X1 [Columba livia]|uniref:gem-associated protein 8 isoform X1 n=2 Tax=Columba livia TaxID=8932 RepID=UPI0031BB2933
MEDAEPWYSRQVYARYWRHYDLAMRWMRRHQRAYRKAMESFYHLPWHPYAASPRSRYSDWDGNDLLHTQNYSSSYRPHGRAPYCGGAQHYTDAHQGREDADRDSEMEEDSESEGEIEYDLSNMEITEELRQFFAQTERHREELRRQQQLEAEQQYVDADQDLHRTERTVEPPTERPGERRMAEMKKLYGAEADKIQAMEAALQLIFDRNCDKKQPKYWPIIPLKLPLFQLASDFLLFQWASLQLSVILPRGSSSLFRA